MYVVVLDVEADQAAEREALNLLSTVVARPDQALEAWSVPVGDCGFFTAAYGYE